MEWVEVVLAGIMATALGAPVGDVLKWVLWKFIAIVQGRLILWGYVGALLNAAPGFKMLRTQNPTFIPLACLSVLERRKCTWLRNVYHRTRYEYYNNLSLTSIVHKRKCCVDSFLLSCLRFCNFLSFFGYSAGSTM